MHGLDGAGGAPACEDALAHDKAEAHDGEQAKAAVEPGEAQVSQFILAEGVPGGSEVPLALRRGVKEAGEDEERAEEEEEDDEALHELGLAGPDPEGDEAEDEEREVSDEAGGGAVFGALEFAGEDAGAFGDEDEDDEGPGAAGDPALDDVERLAQARGERAILGPARQLVHVQRIVWETGRGCFGSRDAPPTLPAHGARV